MNAPEKCPDCGSPMFEDELVCCECGCPRPGFCAEGYDPEEFDENWDEDQYLDDPRRGQAAGLNRDNRGRE